MDKRYRRVTGYNDSIGRLLVPFTASRVPSWSQQRTQFLTRFLFFGFGLAYYNYSGPYVSWPDLHTLNIVFAVYFVFNTSMMLHAWLYNASPMRWRLGLWVDIALLSFCIVADPDPMPPFVAYTMVVLGNGLRYGMNFFREAVLGSFVGALVAFALRYSYRFDGSWPTLFLIGFNVIIILYAYSLMTNVDQARRRLESESRVDDLTGLLNRRALHEQAEILFSTLSRNSRSLVVLFADLDKFKEVNDRLGHTVGDRVLAQVGRLIQSVVRKSDLAARYGGDEFILILPDTTLESAYALAERLRESVHQWGRENEVGFSMSIGIGEAPRHGTDLLTVLANVDKAMYLGKGNSERGGIQPVDPVALHSR
jgi:diguanylate cyclase (GGDEF)-like protein